MAKTDQQAGDEMDQLTTTENLFERYKKVLIYAGVGIFIVIIGIVGYQKFVVEPHIEESQEVYWNAFYDFEKGDTTGTAIRGTENYMGMEEIAEEYNGTPGGDIANYVMAIDYMEKGDYDMALEYLDETEFEDVMVGTLVIGLKGDCYVEKGDYETAVTYFEQAAEREKNEFTTPMFLKKAGLTYEELGDNENAVIAYQKIKDEWPETMTGKEIEKYLVRAQN